MAQDWDRRIMPKLVQTAFTISIGATYKSVEMIKSPTDSASRLGSGLKTLITIPEESGEGLTEKAKSLAGVWMAEGAGLMEQLREAGNKFTRDDEAEEAEES